MSSSFGKRRLYWTVSKLDTKVPLGLAQNYLERVSDDTLTEIQLWLCLDDLVRLHLTGARKLWQRLAECSKSAHYNRTRSNYGRKVTLFETNPFSLLSGFKKLVSFHLDQLKYTRYFVELIYNIGQSPFALLPSTIKYFVFQMAEGGITSPIAYDWMNLDWERSFPELNILRVAFQTSPTGDVRGDLVWVSTLPNTIQILSLIRCLFNEKHFYERLSVRDEDWSTYRNQYMRLEASLSKRLERYPLPHLAALELSKGFKGSVPSLSSVRPSLVYLNWTNSLTLQEFPPWISLKEFGEVNIDDALSNESEIDLNLTSAQPPSSLLGLGISAIEDTINVEMAILEKEHLLERLVSLQLEGISLTPFSPSFFSSCPNLRHLDVHCGALVPLKCLPFNLVTLRVDTFIDEDLVALLTKSTALATLIVGERQTQTQEVIEALPQTLKTLWICVNQIPASLPNSLKELKLMTKSDVLTSVNRLGLLPRDLEVLHVNFSYLAFDQPFIGQFLPPKLKQLVLQTGTSWGHEIGATFPTSLSFLSLSRPVCLPQIEIDPPGIAHTLWSWISKKEGQMDAHHLVALKQVMSLFPADCLCDVDFHYVGNPALTVASSHVAQQAKLFYRA